MKKLYLIPLLFIFACNQKVDNNSNSSMTSDSSSDYIDKEKTEYNPKVDSIYYYPSDIHIISFDTVINDYKIESYILPIPDKYVVSYREYVDRTPKMRRDKIFYQDYKIEIKISGNKGLLISSHIDKYKFSDLLKPNPDNYFIRDVKFMGLEREEFRFDIKICLLDRDEPGAMIKYYIKNANDFRYEDYPKSYYDSIYPEPDFNDEE